MYVSPLAYELNNPEEVRRGANIPVLSVHSNPSKSKHQVSFKGSKSLVIPPTIIIASS